MAGSTRRSFRKAAEAIEDYARTYKKRIPSGIRIIGEEVMTDVKASRPGKGVPRDRGDLAGSGRVEGPDGNDEVTLSFGGAAAPYALVQHERLDYHHDVGEARYLVRGIERWKPYGKASMEALKANAEAAIRIARARNQ